VATRRELRNATAPLASTRVRHRVRPTAVDAPARTQPEAVPGIVQPDDAANLIVGKVVSIADGDTLTILDSTKRQHKIRLEGIDTPERGRNGIPATHVPSP
jgi:endonuclease YncB( thermonuclease family)